MTGLSDYRACLRRVSFLPGWKLSIVGDAVVPMLRVEALLPDSRLPTHLFSLDVKSPIPSAPDPDGFLAWLRQRLEQIMLDEVYGWLRVDGQRLVGSDAVPEMA